MCRIGTGRTAPHSSCRLLKTLKCFAFLSKLISLHLTILNLNTVIAKLFLALVFIAYSYKAVHPCLKQSYMTIHCFEDVDNEDKSSKSEQTGDKEEKKDFSLYFSLIQTQCRSDANLRYSALHKVPPYLGSDHSRRDYSPPDFQYITG